MKVEESLNVTFNESPPLTKLSPLVDDDVGEDEAIENNIKVVNNNNEDESIEVDEVVNIKESKSHTLEQVIGSLNQRTLRSQAQNQSNFFCFISTIEPKNVNEALGDESWVVVMQEELNQFVANDVWDLVPLPKNQSIIGTKWVYRNKLDENGIERIFKKKAKNDQTKHGMEKTKSIRSQSTDKTKITRKPSKTVKHQAREWKSVQEPEAQVKQSKSTLEDKDPKVTNPIPQVSKVTQMVLEV
ncbi:hypothetical protein Tco_0692396 [Tanacetum coccineum]